MEHLQAKAALRYYTAFVNKGVSAIHLFAARGAQRFRSSSPRFFVRLHGSKGRYPGDNAGGGDAPCRAPSRGGIGAVPLPRTRPLSLLAVSDKHGHFQFQGDGSKEHPTLNDRDVTAFFPFQVRPGRWVAAAYVMTRNLAKLYRPNATGTSRFDLPAARFRLTIGGLKARPVEAQATDPLTGKSVPVKVLSRTGGRVVLELRLTDSPRLISLEQE